MRNNTAELRRLAALQDEEIKRIARQRLRPFVELFWPILEPGTPFLPNWHIDLICETLEAVTAGHITRLLINLPPRYMKSKIVSVLWPCWEWLQDPTLRMVGVSYAESLSTQFAVDRRRVLESDLFQRYWGAEVELAIDQRTKVEIHNTRRGVMLATSVGGSVTGKGGNRLIVDDPHNPQQAESDAQRETAIDFFTNTLATRLDDKHRGAIVVVAQRLHYCDLSAVCLDQGYTGLILPAIEEARTELVFPQSGHILVREVDHVLWPARESRQQLEAQRKLLGSYFFNSQYQQNPSPRAGNIFKREWWKFYDELPVCEQFAQSWDLSFKDGDKNDPVVGLVAGRRGADVFLIDRCKKRMSFVETREAILRTIRQYPQAGAIYVEDKANGPAIIDDLKHHVAGIIAVTPEGSKLSRATSCESFIQSGNVYLPRPTGPDGRTIPGREWVNDFIEQFAVFPQGAHDDDVDALTQLLLKWKNLMRRGTLTLREINQWYEEDDNNLSPEERERRRFMGGYEPTPLNKQF